MQETAGRLGNTNYEKPQNGVKIQLFCLVWLAYQSVNLVFSLFVLLTGNGLGSVHLLAQILRRNNVQVWSFSYSCKKNKSLQHKHNTAGAKRCAWNRDWSWNWEINIVGRDRVSNSTQCKVSSGLDHYFSNSIAARKVLTFYKDSTEMAWRRNPFQEALSVVDCTIRLTKLCEGDARLLRLLYEHKRL